MENSLNDKVYSFSFTAYRQRKKVIIFFVGILFFLVPTVYIPEGLYLFLVFTVAFLIFVFIYGKVFEKKLGSLKLKLSGECVERFSEKMREKIFFKDITHLAIIKRPNNKIGQIIVKTENDQWHLVEFEQMEEVADLIQQRIGPDTKIETRQQRVDWQKPQIGFMAMAIIMGVFYSFIIRSFGDFWFLLSWVYFLIVGLYYITRKPTVQCGGARFRRHDVICGVFLLVTVIASILLYIIRVK